MHTVYSEDHRHQDGNVELFEGKVVKPHEIPRRAEIVLAQVKSEKLGEVVGPRDFGLDPILAVHDRGLVTFLQECWRDWTRSGRNFDALPHVWPVPGLLPPNPTGGKARRAPDAIDGKLGHYAFDAGTPIIAGTWRAVHASAQVALTGARWSRPASARPSRCAGRRATMPAATSTAATASSTTPPSRPRRSAIPAPSGSPSSTSTITTATARRRSSTGAATCCTISIHADPKQEFPYLPRPRRRARRRRRRRLSSSTCRCPGAPTGRNTSWRWMRR